MRNLFVKVLMAVPVVLLALTSCDKEEKPAEPQKSVLTSVKAEQYEMTYEYNNDGRVSAFTSWIHDDYMDEKHNAQYSYDEKNHIIHIHDLWTRIYMDDKEQNPTPEITVELTVYVDPLYHRVDSTKERNSTYKNNTQTFVRYFIYDDNDHLVTVTDNWQNAHRTWQVDKTEIEWDYEDIVGGKSRYRDVTFTPSNISDACPPDDSRKSFLSVLERPLLMAGLFGKTPEHLPSSCVDGEYKTEYNYYVENDKIVSVNIGTTMNGEPYNGDTETYVWSTLSLK